MLHSVRLQPYLQTLDQAGKACQGQTLSYCENSPITAVKSFIVEAPGERNKGQKIENYSCNFNFNCHSISLYLKGRDTGVQDCIFFK